MKLSSTLFCSEQNKPRKWLETVAFDSKGLPRARFRRVIYKKDGTVRPEFSSYIIKESLGNEAAKVECNFGATTAQSWINGRWAAQQPITIYPETISGRRINVVTDSVGPSSLFGGVGTALIVAALWAERSGARLRIITRTEAPNTDALQKVLNANGLSFDAQIEFAFCPHGSNTELAVGSEDIFLTTSWWTTQSIIKTVGHERIVYLLQEDERMFYPHGDEHLECSLTLAEPFKRVVINSGLLNQHLTQSTDAVPGLATRSIYFEPAFPVEARICNEQETSTPRILEAQPDQKKRKRLFFYARPENNDRNLFGLGVSVLNEAAMQNILNPEEWELHFVGRKIPEFEFPNGLRTVRHQPMPWADYMAFMRTMDAGLSLMYTPHPSYPPLDLAAMGIPVLTTSFGLKRDLEIYSKNILCVSPNVDALVDGLRDLTGLASDPEKCDLNRIEDHINRDWETALEDVISDLDTCWIGE